MANRENAIGMADIDLLAVKYSIVLFISTSDKEFSLKSLCLLFKLRKLKDSSVDELLNVIDDVDGLNSLLM